MHCRIFSSRYGTRVPDLDSFQIWNFARTGYAPIWFETVNVTVSKIV